MFLFPGIHIHQDGAGKAGHCLLPLLVRAGRHYCVRCGVRNVILGTRGSKRLGADEYGVMGTVLGQCVFSFPLKKNDWWGPIIKDRELSWCQLCRNWWYRMLSLDISISNNYTINTVVSTTYLLIPCNQHCMIANTFIGACWFLKNCITCWLSML